MNSRAKAYRQSGAIIAGTRCRDEPTINDITKAAAGTPGTETLLPLLFTYRGFDAALVILQPHGTSELREDDLHSAAGYSPYAGMEIKRRVATTVLSSQVACDGQEVRAPERRGRLVPCSPLTGARLP